MPVSEVLRTSRPDLARTLPEPDAVGGPSGPEEVRLQLVCLGLLCLTPPGFLCPELGTQRGRGMRAGAAQNLLARPGWGGQRCVRSRAGSLRSGRRVWEAGLGGGLSLPPALVCGLTEFRGSCDRGSQKAGSEAEWGRGGGRDLAQNETVRPPSPAPSSGG